MVKKIRAKDAHSVFQRQLWSEPVLEDEVVLMMEEAPEPRYFTVSEITDYLKTVLSEDPITGNRICVKGELSNVSKSSRGHVYFTLKDEAASLRGVIWAGVMRNVPFTPEDGQEVFISGQIEIYAPSGTYSIVTQSMEPVGVGALQLAFEQLRARLSAGGFFLAEYKKPLPAFPQRIGIVTAPTGSVIHDMLRVLRRKNPLVDVLIAPVPVQGRDAATAIAQAITTLDHPAYDLDVIIIARGGGSFEDLFCFSEEPVVKAIFQSATPIVTGIGHEPDYSLADAAADVRASTPTAAAELAVPDVNELLETVYAYRSAFYDALQALIYRTEEQFDRRATSLLETYKHQILGRQQSKVDRLKTELLNQAERLIISYDDKIARYAAELQALSPLNTLARGYAIATQPNGQVIHAAAQVTVGQKAHIRLAQGYFICDIKEIHP